MEFPEPPHPRKDKIILSLENSTCIMTDYSLKSRNQKKSGNLSTFLHPKWRWHLRTIIHMEICVLLSLFIKFVF